MTRIDQEIQQLSIELTEQQQKTKDMASSKYQTL